jgi:hypothetical protein
MHLGIEFSLVKMWQIFFSSLIFMILKAYGDPCDNTTNCLIFDWQAWSVCTGSCGTSQTRNRLMCCPSSVPVSHRTLESCLSACNKSITYPMNEQRLCCEEGHYHSGKCICNHGYKGTCCQGFKPFSLSLEDVSF